MLRKQNYKRTFWAKGSFKLECKYSANAVLCA